MLRARLSLAAVLLCLAPLGYWMRFRAPLPDSLRDHTGGVLYVLIWIVAAAFVWPRIAPARPAIIVLAVTCTLEFLQLWHPPWLEAIRATFAGRVLIGTTFGWSDFPPYFIGAALGWLFLAVYRRTPIGFVS